MYVYTIYTRPHSVVLRSVLSYNSSGRTPRETRITCQECVFIGLLPSNGCPSVVDSVNVHRTVA
jgi:hypothetical protein